MIKQYKFKLNNGFKITKNNSRIFVSNDATTLNLDNLSFDILKMLIAGSPINNVLKYYQKTTNCDYNNAKREVFLFIYTLINNKIVQVLNKNSNEKIPLLFCMIEITNACNFRCPHCYVDKQKTYMLSKSNLVNIAKDLESQGCCQITLTGGEPLSHPDFKEIYKNLYDNNFLISLNTNGSLINNEWISFFEAYPPLSIEISLYGINDKTYYDFTKTKLNFDQFIKNIEILRTKNINIVFKNVINSSNEKTFYEIKNLSEELKIPFKCDYLIFPQTSQTQSFNQEQINENHVADYLKSQLDAESRYLSLFNKKTNNSLFLCNKKELSIFINSKKEVCLCPCMQNFSIKYKNGHLAEIIKQIKKHLSERLNKNCKCFNCPLKSICRYCPGKFYMTTGSLTNPPDWFCKTAELIYDNFIRGLKIIPMISLSSGDIKKCFNVLCENLKNQGFQISKNDFRLWRDNITSNFKSSHWFLVYNNGCLSGFITMSQTNGQLFCSEIQLDKTIQNTRAIVKIIKFLTNFKQLENFNEVYFNINNNNIKSLKTFAHLSPDQVSSNSNSTLFKVSRSNIKNYLGRLHS